MSTADETVIFLHIPKAGGMTLNRILEQRYPREQIYSLEREKPRQAIERFKALPESERARYRLLKGHVLYGLHEAVPRPSMYITILRDPVERVISQYYYARSRPDHYLYSRLNQKGMTLYEYVARNVTPEISNQQTGMLAGQGVAERHTPLTGESLARAKHNLKTHFRVVGLTEEFDTSLLLLQRAFGWKLPLYLRENVTSEKPRGAQIDSRARELLAERNALDAEIYAFARELFEAQCRAYGDRLGADLARFRQWNGRYQRFAGPLMRWRQQMSLRLARPAAI